MPVCGKCHREAQAGALYCPFCASPILPEPPADASDPYIGKTFRGTYFVQRKVGEGGMGVVYQAMHVSLEIPVALKILRRALLADPAVVQRFHREARAASRLRHPNVVQVTDFGQTEDGVLFMAMDFIAGRSLARVIAEEYPLSEQRVVRIGAQILSALEEAHSQKVLHRDLKPENVVLETRRDEPDAVKVLDFGIAKIQAGDGQGTLTQAGLVCGTPGYMSPEQWGGQPLDVRSDLYSLGVTLYEMLTGKVPFEPTTPLEMVRRHLTERPQTPSQRRPERTFSPALEALVMRAIAVDREERPASAAELRAELLACPLLSADGSVGPDPAARTVFLETRNTPPPARPATPAATARLGPVTPARQEGRPPTPQPVPREAAPRPTPARQRRPTPERVAARAEPPPPSRRGLFLGLGVAALAALGLVAFLLLRAPGEPKAPPVAAAPVAPAPVVPAPVAPTPAPVQAAPPSPEPAQPAGGSASPATAATATPARAEELPPAVADEPPRDEPAPRPRPQQRPRPLVRDTLNAIPTPSVASGLAVLSVQAEPFGDVYLDGRHYGTAPREFQLPAGRYLVRVAHPQLGKRERRFELRPGERARWVADFLGR